VQSRSAWEGEMSLDFEIIQLRRSAIWLSVISAILKSVSTASELPVRATT